MGPIMKAPRPLAGFILSALILSAGPAWTQSLTPTPQPLPSPQPVKPADTAIAAIPVQPPQWRGQSGGSPDFTTQLLRTATAWDSFWKLVDRDPPYKFNEATEMAVVICAGERGTGGFAVRVLHAALDDTALVVVYEIGAPGPDKFVTQVITNPWVIAIVPRTDHKVVFQPAKKTPG
jgi:PrcB C-terminal